LVAVTEQVDPASPGVNDEPITLHVPDTTTYDTEPVPEPPLVDNDNTDPYVADVVDTVNTDCAAF
jgi:hypothetical protein